MAPELAFVLAPRQNLFFHELVEGLRGEAVKADLPTSLHVGNFPPPRADLVYVMVPPHEYFTLMHGRHGPLPEVLKRTIFICGEQPNTPFFDSNVELAPRGGAVFDINRHAVRAFARHEITAEHLQLGWTQVWDHLSERERDIDVLFMGAITDRRMRALGSYAKTFSRYRVELVLSDNSRPNYRSSQSYRSDADKWDLLGRAKILINLHQEDNPYFEWLRIVQAIATGAVVVSEDSVDYEPLVPGEHLLMGDVRSLDLLVELLLRDGNRRWQMQTAAYAKLREEIPLAPAVQRLFAVAAEIADREPVPDGQHRFYTQPEADPDNLPGLTQFEVEQPQSLSQGDANAAWTRRALKDLRLELLELRRAQARTELETARARSVPALERVAVTDTYGSAAPRVSVLTALYNHAGHVIDALDSAARLRDASYELIVVDDGSTDGGAEAVTRWMTAHRDVPVLLLRHPVNQGLAAARNDALRMARGELCFVLDADNEVYPHCLSRLIAALDGDPTTAFAYGSLEMFAGDECVGLMNPLPWEPERLRLGNYIDAMALMRTAIVRDELGGYPTDRRLHGWEDFALWCAIADRGGHAIRVPEILGRYRVAKHSMLSLTNISATDAFSVIIEANPKLMAGIEAPE